jgi:hypothetical protein
MSDKHIISLIEQIPLSSLTESDLIVIRAHVAGCADCRGGYEAAQVALLLTKERAAEAFSPPPFFHTRVLATLRERQAANESWSWSRIWRAGGALASSMVATVAALVVLTFVVPATQSTAVPGNMSSALNAYSAEEVILNQSELPEDQTSDGQILNTLYGAEEDAVK